MPCSPPTSILCFLVVIPSIGRDLLITHLLGHLLGGLAGDLSALLLGLIVTLLRGHLLTLLGGDIVTDFLSNLDWNLLT